ncbi:MAG: tetratricopeptide repeat protein [Chloroflexota bacterium]|nr:tetratricopeptide repeat protein [Chloroflexota bacterium]
MPTIETANVGKADAARVGSNIREVRTRLSMTQSQLASPEFSISYISAIERGKIRPSLKALSVLARRLDVPLTFLLEGSPSGASEARAVGYSPADSGPDQKIDIDLLQARIFVQQRDFEHAQELLAPIQEERITTDQAYQLFLLRGEIHLGLNQYQEAVVDLRSAVTQGENMGDSEYTERARNLLGKAYYFLYNYTLAAEHHQRCKTAIESGQISDPVFALEVFSNLANDHFRLRELDEAVACYHRALELFDNMERDSKSFALKYMDISQKYKTAGKLNMARDYAMRSLALYQMRDEQRLAGLTHQYLGKTLERQDDLTGAEQEYRRALTIEREIDDAVASSSCHTALAELLLKRGDLAGAEKEAQQALEFAKASGDAQTQGQALIALAQLRHNAKDYAGADTFFKEALALLDSSHSHEIAAAAYFRYANMLEERDEVQASLNFIKQAYEHQRRGKRGDIE